MFRLDLDGRPVAVALGFLCKGRLSLHLIAHDMAYEKCAVGALNLAAVLQHCEAAGLDAVDLLSPAADYKLEWTERTTGVADYAVALTSAGQVYSSLCDGLLRPHVKGLFGRLPLGIRKRVAGRLGVTTSSAA